MTDLLIKNIGVLATPLGKCAVSGSAQGEIQLVENAEIAVEGGKISYAGAESGAPNAAAVVDAGGRLVTPGLVDAHTHLVFGGFRQNELEMKLAGVQYLDILRAGGGILSTVRATRAAGEDELYAKAAAFADDMLRHGTTTVETKSGYGLDTETEMKQLRVAARISREHAIDVVSTYMGAHAFPDEYKENREAFVDFLVNEALPQVASSGLAEFADVFAETAVFDIAQSRRVLTTARELGLGVKIHADEINPIGGAQLAAELGAISADHLLQASDEGLDALAASGVIAVCLPATSFYLDKNFARARTMIEKGIPVAIATDFNPGSSPSFNMQFAMTVACLKLRLTPKEALCAATLNAAASIGRADSKGSIEPGKDADIVIWDAPDLNFIFYRYGNNQVHKVIKSGRVIE
ncbi:MAG: imidazolonepropionase [Defluviitaleaceae bacterium]|nr:imidazolonepropionase [Defluviitaleaceae bacterium]